MKQILKATPFIFSIIFIGAGCSAQPVVQVSNPAPAGSGQQAGAVTAASVEATRNKLVAANLQFSEKTQKEDAEKMKTAASIADAMKFKVTLGQGVSVIIVTLKDAAQATAVKAEMNSQYETLKSLSASARIEWLPGDETHLVVLNYKAGDEAHAETVKAALK